MYGKQKCRILKEIRQKIADENDIKFVTQECRHKGECTGTCPRCESELRYLEQQLKHRASLGKKIRLAALCAGMAISITGCSVIEDAARNAKAALTPTAEPEIEVLSGEVPWPEPQIPTPEIAPTDTYIEPIAPEFELSGYVPYE